MNWKNRNRVLFAPADDGSAAAGGGSATAGADEAAAATAATAAATGQTAAAAAKPGDQGTGEGSLLQQGEGGEGGTHYLPEKFRVTKDDGTIDLEASAKKLAGSYAELEKTRPTGGVPKTPEDYKVEGLPEGMNFDEVRKDPVFAGFLKGAHAKGMTNEQLSYALDEYFKLAPDLLEANQKLGADAAKTQLATIWPDDQTLTQNLGLAMRAVKSYGAEGDVPGGLDRLMQRYGNDPDFLAFAAAIGREVQEDVPIRSGSPAAEDWAAQVASIKANPAYADAGHPEHPILVKKMEQLYQRRYPNQPQRLSGTATR